MKTLFVALISSLMTVSAFAQDKGENHPCKADHEKFCKGMKWGEGLGKCLEDHKSELSQACQAKISNIEESHPCMQERAKFCSGKMGKELGECMRSHESELSAACKEKREERKEERQERRAAKKAERAANPNTGNKAVAK